MKITDAKFISRDRISDIVALWDVKPRPDSGGMFFCMKKHFHSGAGSCWLVVKRPDDLQPGQCFPITITIGE